VNRSGRTRPGNKNLKPLLGIAMMVATGKKDSYLGVFFRRIAARHRGKRALVAVMHKLAVAVWHVLHDRAPSESSAPTTSPATIPNAPCAA
jgi:transposase